MPPKNIFTKEQIVQAGLSVVRRDGIEALTARSLAQALGASTKPIFGPFPNMQALTDAVMEDAMAVYGHYIHSAVTDTAIPPYKASGLGYIRFAKEEPHLFKWLFMRDRSQETVGEDRAAIQPLLNLIQQNLGVDADTAYLFHLEMWVYVHGVATMLATNYLAWDMDFISQSLTDVFQGLCRRFKEE